MKTALEFEASLKIEKPVVACPAKMQMAFDAKKAGDEVARHGDLMLVKAGGLPIGAKPVEGHVVLRATEGGNTHGVRGAAILFDGESQNREFGTSRYIVVSGPAEMAMHLEHGDAPLPVGVYEARRKREGRSDNWRRVLD